MESSNSKYLQTDLEMLQFVPAFSMLLELIPVHITLWLMIENKT